MHACRFEDLHTSTSFSDCSRGEGKAAWWENEDDILSSSTGFWTESRRFNGALCATCWIAERVRFKTMKNIKNSPGGEEQQRGIELILELGFVINRASTRSISDTKRTDKEFYNEDFTRQHFPLHVPIYTVFTVRGEEL